MQTTYTLADLEEGRVYFFAVAAYDANGDESEPSREITSNDPVADSEGDAAENGPTDRAEDDPAELDSEAILEDAEEIGSDENDNMNALEQDSDGDKDNDHSEARTQLHVIPQSQLKIVSVDSEPLTGDGAAESAIDGQVKTFWRTKMGAKAPVHPHELVIALGSEYEVRGFRYLSRQDGKTEGMVMRYSFYVSEDGVNWGNAVAAGTFPKDTTEKEVVFPEKMGSFVRFVAHSEVNGGPWTSMAEINILQTR